MISGPKILLELILLIGVIYALYKEGWKISNHKFQLYHQVKRHKKNHRKQRCEKHNSRKDRKAEQTNMEKLNIQNWKRQGTFHFNSSVNPQSKTIFLSCFNSSCQWRTLHFGVPPREQRPQPSNKYWSTFGFIKKREF